MNRTFAAKISVLVGAVVAAVLLTFVRPSPTGLAAFAVGPAEARTAPGAVTPPGAAYDLTRLTVVNQTLVRIRDSYVDPARIDPKAMLYAALDGVQRNVAEVLVEPHKDKDEVVVTVNDKSETFSLKDVQELWTMSSTLKAIFRFIQANINPTTKPVDIEYAAVNGMLGTLDPHSNLLEPEDAREMDVSTSGKFGGIGITIGMRKHRATKKETLTVLNLIGKQTPAAKAGLEAGDYIIRINDDPTENLTSTEAMGRLRGDPGTKVLLTIERKGKGQFVVPIVRDTIMVSTVSGRLLDGKVGYLKIENFGQATFSDLQAKLTELKKQGARAWVLDMRWNPGGLLEQAFRVADLFVESGTVVTTVGKAGKEREERRARVEGTENAPLVVLVNGGAASASEIVAGALKNLNRAVIVGQTTFGKGSVQILYDNDDHSKLKLTIAQYLTPGDVSIQGVGIVPDIELLPMRIPAQIKSERDLLRLMSRGLTKEADLDAHLTSKNARQGDKPSDTVRYIYEAPKPEPGTEDDESAAVDPNSEEPPFEPYDSFHEDWEIKFARDFAAQAATNKRLDAVKESKKFIAARKLEEDKRLSAALAVLGVDWAWPTGGGTGKARLSATFTTDKAGGKLAAGEVVAITGEVKNSGDAPAFRVHAQAKTDDWTFDGLELVFGKILPGETRKFTAYVKIDKDTPSRADTIEWTFTDGAGAITVDAQPTKVTVIGAPRPQFAYTYQLIDNGSTRSNGDGRVQLGESTRLLVTVKNVGPGVSASTTASLRNASGIGIAMSKVRFEVGKLAAGESRTVEFTFDVKPELEGDTAVVELAVYDADMREGLTEKLKFKVSPPAVGPAPASGVVKLKRDAVVRAGEGEDTDVIGTGKRGATFRTTGSSPDWVRLEVEPGRPGFVSAKDVQPASGAPSAATAFVPKWQVTPPEVAITQPVLETAGDRFKLRGTIKDDVHVEDVFVIVSNRQAKIEARKVYYKSNRSGKDTRALPFEADVPVWAGNNQITIVARENDDVRTVQTMYVYRTDGQARAAVK